MSWCHHDIEVSKIVPSTCLNYVSDKLALGRPGRLRCHRWWLISVSPTRLLSRRHHNNKTHFTLLTHRPLTRYVKLQVAHAPGMPGTFFPAADFTGNRWLAIPACITARAWRTCRDACRDRSPAVTGKTFPVFPAHAHPQFYVSGKRPIVRQSTGGFPS